MSDDVINGYSNTTDKIFLNLKPAAFYVSLIFHIALLIIILFFYPVDHSGRKRNITEVSLLSSTEPNKGSTITNTVKTEAVNKVITNSRKPAKLEELDQKKKNITKQPDSTANNEGNTSNQTGSANTANGNSGSGTYNNSGTAAADYYYIAVDQMPVPIGGMQSILSRMNIPENKSSLSSIYILAFIDEFGIVQKCLLIKGEGNNTDQLTLNVIRKTKFQPGVLNGKRVKVQLYISIPVPKR